MLRKMLKGVSRAVVKGEAHLSGVRAVKLRLAEVRLC